MVRCALPPNSHFSRPNSCLKPSAVPKAFWLKLEAHPPCKAVTPKPFYCTECLSKYIYTYQTHSGSLIHDHPRQKPSFSCFSPKGTKGKLPPFLAKHITWPKYSNLASEHLCATSSFCAAFPQADTILENARFTPAIPKTAVHWDTSEDQFLWGNKQQITAAFLVTAPDGKLSSTHLLVITTPASQISSSQLEFGLKSAEKTI